MTHQEDHPAIGQMLEAQIKDGMEGLESVVSILLNEAMKVERSRALGAQPRQRSHRRIGYANSHKPKTWTPASASVSCRCLMCAGICGKMRPIRIPAVVVDAIGIAGGVCGIDTCLDRPVL